MPYYIPNPASKTTCIGNTLSTFNNSFTSLDTSLYNLSVETLNYVNFLSSNIVSVSADLKTQIFTTSSTLSSTLTTKINYVSANVIPNYIRQGQLACPSVGQTLNWDARVTGVNAMLTLTADIKLANITSLISGETGNLFIHVSGTAAPSITSYGSNWMFYQDVSGVDWRDGGTTLIKYYFTGEKILAQNVINFGLYF